MSSASISLPSTTAEALHSTAAVQPALLIAGVATARALMAEHVHPAAVAGMSIGAFGAAVACGTLSFRRCLAARPLCVAN